MNVIHLRSISPSRSPPSRARPSVGCRVRTDRGPRALEYIPTDEEPFTLSLNSYLACILSCTICFNF